MRRRKLLAVSACLILLAAAGAFVLWPSRDVTAGITPENFDRINERLLAGNSNGMPCLTVTEAEAIIGVRPGDYRTGPSMDDDNGKFIAYSPPGNEIYWLADSY
jgi:hypothetical protein